MFQVIPALARRDRMMLVGTSPWRGPFQAEGTRGPAPVPVSTLLLARFEGANWVLCPPLNSNSLATLKWYKVEGGLVS